MSAVALTIFCQGCKKPLPIDAEQNGQVRGCPSCSRGFRIDLFPALIKKEEPSNRPRSTTHEAQSTCFYHENYQAKVACESCGRFLCDLCDVPFLGGHHCVRCIENMQEEKAPTLVNSEFRWLNMAAMVFLISIPFWFMSLLTFPLALIMIIKHFRRKNPVLPTSKHEIVTAILAGLLWVVILGLVIFAMTQ